MDRLLRRGKGLSAVSAYLLEQEDGTIYLGLSADYAEDGSECFCMVYRLEKEDDTIYASMDNYAAACVEDLKKAR